MRPSSFADRNSQRAAEFARKKKEREERARQLREERRRQTDPDYAGLQGSSEPFAPAPVAEAPQDAMYGGAFDRHAMKKQREHDELDQLAAAFDKKTGVRSSSRHGPFSSKPIPQAPVDVIRAPLQYSSEVPVMGGPGYSRSAAGSHHRHDAYMNEFHEAYAALEQGGGGGGPGGRASLPGPSGSSLPVARGRPSAGGTAVVLEEGYDKGGSLGAAGKAAGPARAPVMGGGGWFRGPRDPQGSLIDVSDRPMQCIDVQGDKAVLGSHDHALYTIDLNRGKLERRLYTKAYGHGEWVTTVCFMPGGQIVSGGMDNKVCCWESRGVRCRDLLGHTASVSAVAAVSPSMAVSASYDKSIRCWAVATGKEMAALHGHKAPVLHIAVADDFLASGDRDGVVRLWDLQEGRGVGAEKAHKGHVTAVAAGDGPLAEGLLLSGGQDGCVRVWDPRTSAAVATIAAHTSDKGSGAIAGIGISGDGATLVTAAADCAVVATDIRGGWAPRVRFTEHRDFIFSLKMHGDIALSGSTKGLLLAHDVAKDKVLWGLGANQGEVNCIGASGNRLIASGGDGKALIFDMS